MGRAKRLHKARKAAKTRTHIIARVTADHDEWERDAPGAIYLSRPDGIPRFIFIVCPGCGAKSAMLIRNATEAHTEKITGASWEMTCRDPITLHPSVHHDKAGGGCGWHGWLRNGIWSN